MIGEEGEEGFACCISFVFCGSFITSLQSCFARSLQFAVSRTTNFFHSTREV